MSTYLVPRLSDRSGLLHRRSPCTGDVLLSLRSVTTPPQTTSLFLANRSLGALTFFQPLQISVRCKPSCSSSLGRPASEECHGSKTSQLFPEECHSCAPGFRLLTCAELLTTPGCLSRHYAGSAQDQGRRQQHHRLGQLLQPEHRGKLHCCRHSWRSI